MNIGAVIAGKQNRYMRRFRRAGATNPSSARTLSELGCRESFVFDRLVRQGVFVEVSEGRFYLDSARTAAFRARRRLIVLLALGIVAVTLAVLMWAR